MAKQVGGILGPVRGKVSNVVGARWKETPYFRAYAIPANPRTTLQTQQRARMTACVWMAKALLGPIINPYWDPFTKTMSGYNRFCQVNLKLLGQPIDYLKTLITEGKLEPTPAVSSATYDPTLPNVTIVFSATCMGNGLPTDSVIACVLDVVNNVAFFLIGDGTRTEASTFAAVGTGRTVANLKAFVGFYRGAGSTLMVSSSVSCQVTAS